MEAKQRRRRHLPSQRRHLHRSAGGVGGAQAALAGLATYQTTKIGISRKLNLLVSPRSTVGAFGRRVGRLADISGLGHAQILVGRQRKQERSGSFSGRNT
jgi:hypothetical protein